MHGTTRSPCCCFFPAPFISKEIIMMASSTSTFTTASNSSDPNHLSHSNNDNPFQRFMCGGIAGPPSSSQQQQERQHLFSVQVQHDVSENGILPEEEEVDEIISTTSKNSEQRKHHQNRRILNVLHALSFEPRGIIRNHNKKSRNIVNSGAEEGENDISETSLYGSARTTGTGGTGTISIPTSSQRFSATSSLSACFLSGSSDLLLPPPSSVHSIRHRRNHRINFSNNKSTSTTNSLVKASSTTHHHHHQPKVKTSNMLHGTLDPDGGVEVVFYDAMEYGDKGECEFEMDFTRESVVLSAIRSNINNVRQRSVRGGAAAANGPWLPPSSFEADAYSPRMSQSFHQEASVEVSHQQHQHHQQHGVFHHHPEQQNSIDEDDEHSRSASAGANTNNTGSYYHADHDENSNNNNDGGEEAGGYSYSHLPYVPAGVPPPPPPPTELPLRFLRAGKGDPAEGLRRYEATLAWRAQEGIDTILREANPQFGLIKHHYPHYCYGYGKLGEPCYYEQPPKTNLKALREGGVTLDMLLRHYIMVTEFQWQFLERDDLQRSIYVIDLEGMRFGDFVGEVVDFVKRASYLSAQHYPERAGYVFVINVPGWFKVIWSVVRPMVDEATLDKIYILRGAEEIRTNMEQRIAIENIPMEYGGLGPPLAESQEESLLTQLVEHNNALAAGKPGCCAGPLGNPPCKFCTWVPPRSY